jgi:hypothetical protein
VVLPVLPVATVYHSRVLPVPAVTPQAMAGSPLQTDKLVTVGATGRAATVMLTADRGPSQGGVVWVV